MKTSTRQPAYKLAATEVKRYIEAHGLGGGDALPSEAALSQELGMSRPSLREGLKALESLGIIETRHGEGVFVAHFSFDPIVRNLPYSLASQGASLRELLEVRAALEVGMIAQVVRHIGAADRAELRRLARRMVDLSVAGQGYAEEDRAFHATLFRCTGNQFLLSLVDLFWQVFTRLADQLPVPDASAQRATALDHLRVVEMLEQGEVAALEEAHRRHFDEISRRLNPTAVTGPERAVGAPLSPLAH